jgi:hypothetical protein
VRAGTEIRLEQGVVDDDGVEHWWSQGVYRPSKPSVSRDAGGLSIAVDLHDRSYSVKLASIRRRWVIAGDAPILAGIATVLAEGRAVAAAGHRLGWGSRGRRGLCGV